MIILDTNILSELMRQTPEVTVGKWLDRQPRTSIWITSITLFEVRFGMGILPTGRRRTQLLEALHSVLEVIDRRIVSFDRAAAELAGDLMASRQKRGRPIDLRDTMIAGIVLANHATLATRNRSHFDDIDSLVVDPWAA